MSTTSICAWFTKLNSKVIDNVFRGVPGCVAVKSSNRLYVDWVLLMVLDIGKNFVGTLVCFVAELLGF